jgi:hypothetical protein
MSEKRKNKKGEAKEKGAKLVNDVENRKEDRVMKVEDSKEKFVSGLTIEEAPEVITPDYIMQPTYDTKGEIEEAKDDFIEEHLTQEEAFTRLEGVDIIPPDFNHGNSTPGTRLTPEETKAVEEGFSPVEPKSPTFSPASDFSIGDLISPVEEEEEVSGRHVNEPSGGIGKNKIVTRQGVRTSPVRTVVQPNKNGQNKINKNASQGDVNKTTFNNGQRPRST